LRTHHKSTQIILRARLDNSLDAAVYCSPVEYHGALAWCYYGLWTLLCISTALASSSSSSSH